MTLVLLLMPSMVAAQDAKGDAFVLQACQDANSEAYLLAEGIFKSMDQTALVAKADQYSRLLRLLEIAGGPLTKAHLEDKQDAFPLIEANALACVRNSPDCDRSDTLVYARLGSTFWLDCRTDFRGN